MIETIIEGHVFYIATETLPAENEYDLGGIVTTEDPIEPVTFSIKLKSDENHDLRIWSNPEVSESFKTAILNAVLNKSA
jgi:hypothetical protein